MFEPGIIQVKTTRLDVAKHPFDPGPFAGPALGLAVGRPIGVGDVQVEAEFSNAGTGQELVSGIDRRVGGKSVKGKFEKWDDAKASFDEWAERWHTKFVEIRKKGTAS